MKTRWLGVTIMVIAVLFVLVCPAFAATSLGTAVISSNPGEGIEVIVNGGISNWTLEMGDNIDTTGVNMSVGANDNWIVYIRDSLDGGKPAGSEGHMAEFNPIAGTYVSGGYILDHPLQIRSENGAFISLSGVNQQIESGSVTSHDGTSYNISVKQMVDFDDARLYSGHYYRAVVTFVGQNA